MIHQKITDLAAAPSFPTRPLNATELAHGILVRVPNWLGDAVMTLPALRVLKKILPPDAPLTVIATGAVSGLFEALPLVDRVLELTAPHQAWTATEKQAVRECNCRVGVLFNNSLRDVVTLRTLGVNRLYGRAARFRGLLMARSFRFPKWHKGRLNHCHHANEYRSIVEAMGAPHEPLMMPELKPKFALDLLAADIQALCEHPNLLVLAPGAAYGAAKRWDSENFHAVAAHHIAHGGIVAILGSAKEREIGMEIARGLPENKLFNLSGGTHFTQLLYLLRSARFCVTNDSGLMHLAAALGTPGAAIFGPTDYCATGPVADNWTVFYEKTDCSPCFSRVCPRGSRLCMKKIDAAAVIAVLP